MSTNNPLRQFFRRPAVYLKLPSQGQGYPAGVLEMSETGELPVYPMTAIDDITVKTPDALFNGVAVVDVIRSCIPSIKDPWQLKSVDMDAVLIAIKSASSTDGELEIDTACPKCNESEKYGVNLGLLLGSIKMGDYNKELSTGDLKIKFKPLTYKEQNEIGAQQFSIQRMFTELEAIEDPVAKTAKGADVLKLITETSMESLAKTIEYIQIPTGDRVTEVDFINDFLRNSEKSVYEEIRDYNSSLKEQSDTKPLQITCPHCGNQYEQAFTLNMTDFFG